MILLLFDFIGKNRYYFRLISVLFSSYFRLVFVFYTLNTAAKISHYPETCKNFTEKKCCILHNVRQHVIIQTDVTKKTERIEFNKNERYEMRHSKNDEMTCKKMRNENCRRKICIYEK